MVTAAYRRADHELQTGMLVEGEGAKVPVLQEQASWHHSAGQGATQTVRGSQLAAVAPILAISLFFRRAREPSMVTWSSAVKGGLIRSAPVAGNRGR